MDLGLRGRVALITGSSSGIGRATAEAFGEEGCRVTVTYRRNRAEAQQTAETIVQRGGEGNVEHLDLNDIASIRSAIESTVERWGRVDILVNNAVEWPEGIGPRPIEEGASAESNHLVRVNLEGMLAAIQHVVPAMRANRWGRIVNVSSVAATDGMPGFTWYSAVKAASHGLTRTLAKELGPAGILVNTVLPGATLTNRVKDTFDQRRLDRIAQFLPIRRVPSPSEIGEIIVFLCSQRNTVITGEIIRTSGGRR